jgi:enoyl-CoA hydratase/carnithine racemase
MSILLEKSLNDGVVLLTINRPEALNALNLELRQALSETFSRLAQEHSVRCVVVTGNEKAFVAGADIKLLAQSSPMEVQRLGLHHYWQSIAEFPKPLVAAVQGYALGGGCELALHADIVIAGHNASFGQPEINLGIMPGAGGSQRLVRLVGSKRAMRLLLTGEIINAEIAYDWGLISQIAPDEEVLETALRTAGQIARMPPEAAAHIKETVSLGQDMPLSAALTLERRAFNMLFDTHDQKEGMAAFLEKRKPVFKGK